MRHSLDAVQQASLDSRLAGEPQVECEIGAERILQIRIDIEGQRKILGQRACDAAAGGAQTPADKGRLAAVPGGDAGRHLQTAGTMAGAPRAGQGAALHPWMAQAQHVHP